MYAIAKTPSFNGNVTVPSLPVLRVINRFPVDGHTGCFRVFTFRSGAEILLDMHFFTSPINAPEYISGTGVNRGHMRSRCAGKAQPFWGRIPQPLVVSSGPERGLELGECLRFAKSFTRGIFS